MSLHTHLVRRSLAALLFINLCMPTAALEYTVGKSDTLFGLSAEFGVSVNRIIRANGLDGTDIRIGQELLIPVEEPTEIIVRPGETLSALSVAFGIPVADIMTANALEDASLRIGQKLLIPLPPPEGMHRVMPGDTLTGISARYGLSLAALKAYNGLENDLIQPDQILIVKPDRPEAHEVDDGESLWTIASRYGLAMNDLRSWNHLQNDVIHPGTALALFPGINPSEALNRHKNAETETLEAAVSLPVERPEIRHPDIPAYGEYFYTYPDRPSQPDDSYWEESGMSAMGDYRRALSIMELFEEEIEAQPVRSNALAGWHVIIDPGHGGMDPGAIVTVRDGNGDALTVTEDEYAYDVSLRLYRALRSYGASVSLTILAPDHHIRDGENPRQTFVHRKNEVYNSESHNGNAGWRPVGTVAGLDLRKEIAADQIRQTPMMARRKGTLFVSIHADNSPDLPAGRAVLFDGETESEIDSSRRLATAMASRLGAGSFIKNQSLRVLRDNPADAAVLVEIRNIHYDRNCWALRSQNLREQDALMVADGILDWASR